MNTQHSTFNIQHPMSAGRGRSMLNVEYWALNVLFFLFTAPLLAATWTENFAADPAANGWQVFGATNLYRWNSTNQNLEVTWDSSQTNSFFYRPLGTILTRDDDFSLSFDLTFSDYASGVSPGKTNSAPVAIGFLNLAQAEQTNFLRGTGINSTYGPKNLVEFNFFPAFSTFLPTIDQVVVSTNNSWLYNQNNLLEMTPGQLFHVAMNYLAATHTLTTVVSNNGAQYGVTQTITVTAVKDFRVTAFSITSYSDARTLDSLLAHGVMDNLVLTVPPPPVQNFSGAFTNNLWLAQFTGRSNWLYTLEASMNLAVWTAIATTNTSGGLNLLLADTYPPAAKTFYRIRADRP